jgi:hypothetical protein
MDVVGRSHALTSALQGAVGASATGQTWTQIASYLEQLAPQVKGLTRQLGRSRAVGSALSPPHLQRVRNALDQVRETFNAEPDQLGQGEVAGALRKALTDAVIKHREGADEEWSTMGQAVLDDCSEGFLRLYTAVPDAEERAQKASALRARIASVTTAPVEIEDLEGFKQAVDALRQLLDELRSVALPSEVGRFLESALRGDARWAQLTPDVVEWLSEHEMLPTLRVKIV